MDAFFTDFLLWLVKTKQQLEGSGTISSVELVANAIIKKVAIMLLTCADTEDQARRFNKSTVSAFYSAGMLLDVCMVFGNLSENLMQLNKYAKWRASHLLDCLNTGTKPSDSTLKLGEGILNNSSSQKPVYILHSSDLDINQSVLQDCASALPNLLPLQKPPPKVPAATSIPASHPSNKKEPFEQALRFCKNASKALTRKDIPNARNNLLAAIILSKKQKNVQSESNTSDISITNECIEAALQFCQHASSSLDCKDFSSASFFFGRAMSILNQVESNSYVNSKMKILEDISISKEICATPTVTTHSADHLLHNLGGPPLTASSSTLFEKNEKSNVTSLTPQVVEQAQLLCKRASISLTYQDMEQAMVARDSLRQAFKLLKKEIKLAYTKTAIQSIKILGPTTKPTNVNQKTALNARNVKLPNVGNSDANLEGSKLASSGNDSKIQQSDRPPILKFPYPSLTQYLTKTVRGILNKLTPSNFDMLLPKIESLPIYMEEHLAAVIKLVFEKAVREPQYSFIYAKMCKAMSTKEVTSSENSTEKTNFRKLLLTTCQDEFEKGSARLVEIKRTCVHSKYDKKWKEVEDVVKDITCKYRRQSLGNVRFIGELFELKILPVKFIHQCITRLLTQPDDEESLECLCRLLEAVGKGLQSLCMSPTRLAFHARLASNSSNVVNAVSDDGEDRSQVSFGKSSSLRYAYKDDQWSPVNPSGKKVYDRNFLLELQNHPASMKKHDGLPNLEVVRDKQSGAPMKRVPMGSDFTPPFLKMTSGKPQELPQPSLLSVSDSNQEIIDQYFRILDRILNERKFSNRIRLIIMNLIDLRKNDWESRLEDGNIRTTIDEIREDVVYDEEERELGCKPKH